MVKKMNNRYMVTSGDGKRGMISTTKSFLKFQAILMGMVRGVIIPSGMAAHENQKNKQEVHFLPPPYIVVQTLESRLRKMQEK